MKVTLTIANKGDDDVDSKLVVSVPEGFAYVSSSVRPRTKTTTLKPAQSDGLLYWDVLPTAASSSKRSQLKVSITLHADKTAEAGTYDVYSYLQQGLKPECLEIASSEVRIMC